MARKRKETYVYVVPEVAKKFAYEDEVVLPSGFTIVKGEIFKISGKNIFGVGERGGRFKFYRLTTNVNTGKQWVDCFEMFRGRPGVMRSFAIERIKRIPVRRRRVSRTKSN